MTYKKTCCFELCNCNIDILLFIVKTNDMEVLREEFARCFDNASEFFSNEVVAIDIRPLEGAEQILPCLIDLLKKYRMRPIGIIANDAQRQSAQHIGQSLPLPLIDVDISASQVSSDAVPQPLSQVSQVAQESTQESTMIFDKPLRSGQQIYAQGDLVILGPINCGAEVMAVGNLYIYAPLRGRALAGVCGKQEARIFCTCLEAELISIAGIYQTAETPQLAKVRSQSIQVRLVGKQLVMVPLQIN